MGRSGSAYKIRKKGTGLVPRNTELDVLRGMQVGEKENKSLDV